jgi:hypothetical protein
MFGQLKAEANGQRCSAHPLYVAVFDDHETGDESKADLRNSEPPPVDV